MKEMEKETTYNSIDLESGKCTCCGEQSNEILIGDGRCIDCIEAEKFEEESRRLWGDDQPELPWI